MILEKKILGLWEFQNLPLYDMGIGEGVEYWCMSRGQILVILKPYNTRTTKKDPKFGFVYANTLYMTNHIELGLVEFNF